MHPALATEYREKSNKKNGRDDDEPPEKKRRITDPQEAQKYCVDLVADFVVSTGQSFSVVTAPEFRNLITGE